MTEFRAVLTELAFAERDLQRAWGSAAVAITNGTLSEPARDAFHTARDHVFALEQATYTLIQRATANLPGFRLDEWVPAPTRMADLPPLVGGTTQAALSAMGLGIPVPPAVWAAVVIVAIVEVAALAWVLSNLAEVTADFLTRLYQVRQNTLRYERELVAQQARFQACIRAGRSFQECGSTFALPRAPQENPQPPDRTSTLKTGLAALGVATVVGGAFWAYGKYGKRKA